VQLLVTLQFLAIDAYDLLVKVERNQTDEDQNGQDQIQDRYSLGYERHAWRRRCLRALYPASPVPSEQKKPSVR
jgi:hypothetical protein